MKRRKKAKIVTSKSGKRWKKSARAKSGWVQLKKKKRSGKKRRNKLHSFMHLRNWE